MNFGKTFITILAAFFITAIITQPTTAATFVRIGLHGGGDKLGIPTVTAREINAGSGLSLEAGFVYMNGKSQSSGRSTELSLGAIIAEQLTPYESVYFTRFTLNASHYLHHGQWRFGAGLTYHFGTRLSYERSFETETDFDAAAGITLQADRMFYDGLYRAGVKATAIEYKSDEFIDVDGSSIGFYAGAYF